MVKPVAKTTRKLSDTARTRARSLRRDMTKSERLLWDALRNRTLQNWKFVRQHPIGPYFADFACRKAKLIVELDGEGHSQTVDHDEKRDAYLKMAGYRVIRIPSVEMIKNADGVVADIEQALL
jgi:very-short-patch-repair endonuclease